MKKYIFMAAALMMMGMGMSSCSNDDVINEVEQAPKKVQLTLTASFDMGGETRAAAWDTDGITPKFANGDQVGVYSDNSNGGEYLTASVDGDGIATLTGTVTAASTYHLVYPYKSGSTYNNATKKITGFADFALQEDAYPSTALHYAKLTSLSNKASFKPLCAILKCSCPTQDDFEKKEAYIRSANITSPVINITNDGAEVVATIKEGCDQQTGYKLNCLEATSYFPVAPGSVTLTNAYGGAMTKTATVDAGKIYNINMSRM